MFVRENIEKSSSKSMHSSGTAFSDTSFGDEAYAQMRFWKIFLKLYNE